jgi:thiamine transporter
MTRLRGRLNTVDPWNLTQVILAEGKCVDTPKSAHTKILAEIIVFSALSGVLYLTRVYTLIYGGSVTLGSMVPVMWLSMRRGIRVGFIAGVVYGILAFLIDVTLVGAANIIVTPVQVVLEYPLAFGLIGLTGMFHRKTVAYALAGASISVFMRFLVHYFVGVFVWYALGFPVVQFGPFLASQWVWPAIYNGSFLSAEFAISATLLAILVKRKTLDYGL